IALVVWLVLIFLSVTEGIERSWLKKLTALNAPIRITPTEAYYHSYYHLIDTVSGASHYGVKSLEEKRNSLATNPYSKEEDPEIPAYWPEPEIDAQGNLRDLVKEVFSALDSLKDVYPGLVAQEYEVTGALLKLRLIRPTASQIRSEDKQSFLTQMSYIASFSEESPFVHELLLPPTIDDVNHLLYLASLSSVETGQDIPLTLEPLPSLLAQARVQDLLSYVTLSQVKTKTARLSLPYHSLPEGKTFQATAILQEGKPTHVLLAKDISNMKAFSSKYTLEGSLKRLSDRVEFYPKDTQEKMDITYLPFYTEEPLTFQVQGEPSKEMKFSLAASLQNQEIKASFPWNHLEATQVLFKRHFDTPPLKTPLWPYFVQKKCFLPRLQDKDQAAILPKNFQDAGVKLGDRGYLSYGVTTANATQEQRLPIYVAGFYDPGVMAVGTRCILMHRDVVHDLASSSSSFILDPQMTSGIQVWFANSLRTKEVAACLQALFKENGLDRYFDITSFYDYDFAKDLMQQFQSDKYLFTLVGGIILIVACSNIVSFLVLMVNDKKKEIGILQSMGASKKSIAFIFAFCGATLGILGSVIGSLAAFFTMHHIDSLVGLLSFLQGHDAFHAHFYGNSLPAQLSTEACFFVIVSTPILSLIAGLVPAIKACRLRPAETLRS
ncbi:MAG: ABC transporter permease, partial [Chlamydiae bacterium]|nr:ABC transporter permease [Chlamydiota bacterium]